MFQPVASHANFPALEEEILQFWREQRVYEESLAQRAGAPKFVFYEGPPTANGLPHPGHCLTRAMKDLFPRYRTMRGYCCERKGGWDTHGLPVEVEVCKEIGIHSKEEIESYGVEPFIHQCQKSVWRYMKQWERLTERLGFWIHLDEAYVTYHQEYLESVWWSLKNFFDRGLLYQGHKIVWWWAQGGTALSSGEVGQGYREVADPSVYVRFPLVDDSETSLLVWTTTPWTLPSNQFAAVHPDLEYVTVTDAELGQKLILAKQLLETISQKVKRELTVESTCQGSDLIGRRFVPPFDYYYKTQAQQTATLKNGQTEHLAWRIIPAPFVTTESGTGIVHQAPAFGEVDYEVLLDEQQRFAEGQGPQLINAVAPDGTFTDEAPDYRGRWVKEADKDIARDLHRRGLLYHREQYLHDYPFCWRAEDDPLIQYPRKSWFIRTTEFKDRLLANNSKVNWLPDHIREGRMGNFLESNVDWALSRERYWGTPLPIWVCDKTGKMEAIANYDELMAKPDVQGTHVWEEARSKSPELPDDLRVHKPYIDAITYQSPFATDGRMSRVPEVIDCWYDSGAMPFAQWGYPRKNQDRFQEQFPAQFISEALDQTRGWFYSLMAISTMLFSEDPSGASKSKSGQQKRVPQGSDADVPTFPYPHPYENCIVLGLMLGEDGGKMSKSKRNYREPSEIFDRYGADALRWYFFANQAPWTSIRYSERAIKESIPEFLLRLWNCYSFFVIYANIDGFDPTTGRSSGAAPQQMVAADFAESPSYCPTAERGELDRWIMGELHRTTETVIDRMDAYDNYVACSALNQFVDALSNWYVRRSRDRFWGEDKQDQEKLNAYWTLYECLLTTSKLIAPFTPFLSETLWQNLAGVFGPEVVKSVHLCDYPVAETSVMDPQLGQQMQLLREIASLGRAARMDAKLKVRQPLAKVEVILADTQHQPWLKEHDELLSQELNVKEIEYTTDAQQYISYQVQPNFKRLGPRIGKLMPAVKQKLGNTEGGELLAQMESSGKILLDVDGETVELDNEDIEIRLQAKSGWAAAQGSGCVVVLSTELSPQLIREGLARDVVRLIQEQRKQLDCQFTDHIQVTIHTEADQLRTAIDEFLDYIQGETLAVALQVKPMDSAEGPQHKVSGLELLIAVKVVDSR